MILPKITYSTDFVKDNGTGCFGIHYKQKSCVKGLKGGLSGMNT